MKKLKGWGMVLSAASVLALAGAAVAQQPLNPPPPGAAVDPAAPGARAAPPPSNNQPFPPPRATGRMEDRQLAGDRSMAANDQHAELGVWLVPSAGPGVEIRNITAGSPADMAGLQPGDVILQVNEQGATSPHALAQMIRDMPPGEAVTIQVWRDGQTHQLQATLAPAGEQRQQREQREPYEAAYRGDGMRGGAGSNIAARTSRLEEQLTMVMQELRQLREEMAQLRQIAGSQPAGAAGLAPPAADAGFNGFADPAAEPGATPPDAAAPAANQFGAPGAAPPADAAAQPDPFADGAAQPPAAEPAAEEPAAEPAADDLFGGTATEDVADAPATEEPAGTLPAEPTEEEAEPAEEEAAGTEAEPLFE